MNNGQWSAPPEDWRALCRRVFGEMSQAVQPGGDDSGGLLQAALLLSALDRHCGEQPDPADLRRLVALARVAIRTSRLEGSFVECADEPGATGRILYDYLRFEFSGHVFYRYKLAPAQSDQTGNTRCGRAMILSQIRDVQVLRVLAPTRIAFACLDLRNDADEAEALDILFARLEKGGVIAVDHRGRERSIASLVNSRPGLRLRRPNLIDLPCGLGLIMRR
ncbi:hypothetical protein [Chitinimonas koreensis]|uniref:hypothetical protein n=1 Tax=Chitinimonas koreensis TaxID=356302 RepID=UPI00042973CB|nr:hypothetical protein [Chitinimonas koreensis]QNM97975.1 hypothetical protein H9L41_06875 [Chitinimonas koreensis]